MQQNPLDLDKGPHSTFQLVDVTYRRWGLEYLQREIRTNSWGYAPDEKLDETDLQKIKYDGIRPAPGYPS